MKNKKGFIATSLIYSFFLAFVTLFLTVVADYLQNKVLLNSIEEGIKTEVNDEIYVTDFRKKYGTITQIKVVDSCEVVDSSNNCSISISDTTMTVCGKNVNFVTACYNADGTLNKNKVMIK